MRFAEVFAAACLAASSIEAAPRGISFRYWYPKQLGARSHAAMGVDKRSTTDLDCPTGVVVTSTTTIDVTVYITAETTAQFTTLPALTPTGMVSIPSTVVTTKSSHHITNPTATPTPTQLIDVAMTPIITSELTSTPVSSPEPTRTACEDDKETGKPDRDVAYCGVSGEPAGVYFIAEFIEERSGVPVSEEGCYQFCNSVMESTDGCQSYRFYHNDLGAPRCALYGMPVSWVVEGLDEMEESKWYDVGCGSPSSREWQTPKMDNKGNEKSEEQDGEEEEDDGALIDITIGELLG